MATIVTIPKEQHRDSKPRYKVRWRQSDGKTSNKTFRRKEDATAFRIQVESNAQHGIVTNPTRARRLVRDVVKDWQDATAANGKRTSSTTRDETICRLHIEPAIGSRRIGSVTDEDVQAMVNAWKITYMPRTVQRHYAVLRAVFAYAVRKKIIPTSPCVRGEIALPRAGEVVHPVLTAAEVQKLALELGDNAAAMMWLGIEGLRWAEAAGMTADRLDFTTGRLRVDRQWNRAGEFATPKSSKSSRSFAMTGPLADELRALLERRGLTTDSPEHLFVGRKGAPIRYNNWRTRVWNPACERAGLPGLKFHDLRALAATSMIAAGVDPKTAQSRLGHESITTTLDIYARQSPEADRLAAAAIGELFR